MTDPFESSDQNTFPDIASRTSVALKTGVFIADACHPSWSIVFASKAFCDMTGYTADEVLNKDCLFFQDSSQSAFESLYLALSNQKEIRATLHNRRKDGSQFWCDLFISPLTNNSGKVTHFVCIQTEISEQNQDDDCSLSHQSYRDALTELPSRQLLNGLLNEATITLYASEHNTALLIIAIDHFKRINNSVDYDGADALLQSVADRLRNCIGENDHLLRHGVDEFAIILSRPNVLPEVKALSTKISCAIATPFIVKGKKLHVTCSIGIALYPQDGSDPASLLKYADAALTRAKELGRNNSQFFSDEMSMSTVEHLKLETELRSALEHNQLHLYYQPLIDLQTGQITSLEALSRWEHPELGAIPALRFISIAEDCGLITEIGEWVFRTACRDMRTWKNNGIENVRVAVNVSPAQFLDPLLAQKIEAELIDNDIAPGQLRLEITENVLMLDTPFSEASLSRLKQIGVELVLDDFGTGFSSLNYLKRFSFAKVKIDRAFVEDVGASTDGGAISKAIISMSHSLGIRVVAEGVETEEQCDFLRRNMCDEIQGHLFSKALNAVEIEQILREKRKLPAHLLRFHKPPRTLLIVDDETNIVTSIKRMLRKENYNILTASSGEDGLDLLAKHNVDVIISDHRMPGMTGVDFLSRAKAMYPHSVRIVLSGYTEIKAITDAINQGAIYKFLTKPWDDDQLRAHISEAFRNKEMADENMRLSLEVQTANFQLASAKRRLEDTLAQQEQRIANHESQLDAINDVLHHLPTPVIRLDHDNRVTFFNHAAQALFPHSAQILGANATDAIPEIFNAINNVHNDGKCNLQLDGVSYQIMLKNVENSFHSSETFIILSQI